MSPYQSLFSRSLQSSGEERCRNTGVPYNVISVLTDMSKLWWEFIKVRGKISTGIGKGDSEKVMRLVNWITEDKQELVTWRCGTDQGHCLFEGWQEVCRSWITVYMAKAFHALLLGLPILTSGFSVRVGECSKWESVGLSKWTVSLIGLL